MILSDPTEEARRIIQEANQSGLLLRLLGGIAVSVRCPSSRKGILSREYRDLDFMAHGKQSRQLKEFFLEQGYSSRDLFNAMQGHKRLIFNDLQHERRADIFLDVFQMCHKFDLKDRLGLEDYTIPLADLLATKLQIVEITEKDVKDIASILVDHEIGSRDSEESINGKRLAKLCSDDWGIYRTFTLNLTKIGPKLDSFGFSADQKRILEGKIDNLMKLIEGEPKTFRWKMRAAVGEKVRWYELPEIDKEVVDSRLPNDGN